MDEAVSTDAAWEAQLDAALARGRAWLAGARNADGSWGYLPGGAGRPEPTLLVATAGLPLASDWLSARDPGWAGLLIPAIAWDIDRALSEHWTGRILQTVSSPVQGVPWYDATIPAWSWRPGTAAWVEPTCYAMMSLRRAGQGTARIADGERLLMDRQCADGGWNYGSPRVLGEELDGGFSETAWAVLALTPGAPANRGLEFLKGVVSAPSTLSLALAALAAHKHGQDARPYVAALLPRLGPEGARRRVDWTALALAAIAAVREDAHVFG